MDRLNRMMTYGEAALEHAQGAVLMELDRITNGPLCPR